MQETQAGGLISFIPLLILSAAFCLVGYFLAKDKGRPVWRWTLLCAIPIFNMFFLAFLIGSTSLRLEKKLDAILNGTHSNPSPH
ncbi:hypothetical protein [Cupriavidus sp. D39]|uniref:hypothetical protein n=1 Tax=Cupriavidus sp. D39 TaxID=2997877 RepID=UPI00226F2EC4|nr:hypothetical protein [Cupriavidus sp. D39]MCY0852533.1 hypothetical protein [Cupriavidus sp. D39]